MSPTTLPLFLALFFAPLDWLAVARHWKPLEFIAKPAVMLFLMAYLWQETHFHAPLGWFALALFFSLLGDIFLMLPKENFIGGLVSFLLAHLAYIVGLNQQPPPLNLPALLIVLGVGAVGVQIFRRLRDALRSGGQGHYVKPVGIYATVIAVMLISALWTLAQPVGVWADAPSLLVSGGALLFFLSDTFLAWGRFIRPLPGGRALVHALYHLGQIGLLLGALLHYGG